MPQPVRVPPPVTAKSVESIQPAKPASVQSNQPVVTESVKSIQPTQPASQKPAVDSSKLPGEEVNRPGWNCDASNKDENWNCQLVGADPKGKAEAVAINEPMMEATDSSV